jgi:MFS family permease
MMSGGLFKGSYHRGTVQFDVADLKGFDLYARVATSYMLTSVVTIPIFGRLGELFGHKPLPPAFSTRGDRFLN